MENSDFSEVKHYHPGDPELIEKIVFQLKLQGFFDEFRKECLADVDTKPAYQNLRQRVDSSVAAFLNGTTWSASLNKKNVRENLRKHVYDCRFLDSGVERIVEQVVNPKICSVFMPKVEEVVYQFLGIKVEPSLETESLTISNKWSSGVDKGKSVCGDSKPGFSNLNGEPLNLLPEELEPISPDHDIFSDHEDTGKTSKEITKSIEVKKEEINDVKKEVFSPMRVEVIKEEKIDDDISPDFEPHHPRKDADHSADSELSGISDMTSLSSPKQNNLSGISENTVNEATNNKTYPDGEIVCEEKNFDLDESEPMIDASAISPLTSSSIGSADSPHEKIVFAEEMFDEFCASYSNMKSNQSYDAGSDEDNSDCDRFDHLKLNDSPLMEKKSFDVENNRSSEDLKSIKKEEDSKDKDTTVNDFDFLKIDSNFIKSEDKMEHSSDLEIKETEVSHDEIKDKKNDNEGHFFNTDSNSAMIEFSHDQLEDCEELSIPKTPTIHYENSNGSIEFETVGELKESLKKNQGKSSALDEDSVASVEDCVLKTDAIKDSKKTEESNLSIETDNSTTSVKDNNSLEKNSSKHETSKLYEQNLKEKERKQSHHSHKSSHSSRKDSHSSSKEHRRSHSSKSSSKDGRDTSSSKDNKESSSIISSNKPSKDLKDLLSVKELKSSEDSKDSKSSKDFKEVKVSKDSKEPKSSKDLKPSRDHSISKEVKEDSSSKDRREHKEREKSKDSKSHHSSTKENSKDSSKHSSKYHRSKESSSKDTSTSNDKSSSKDHHRRSSSKDSHLSDKHKSSKEVEKKNHSSKDVSKEKDEAKKMDDSSKKSSDKSKDQKKTEKINKDRKKKDQCSTMTNSRESRRSSDRDNDGSSSSSHRLSKSSQQVHGTSETSRGEEPSKKSNKSSHKQAVTSSKSSINDASRSRIIFPVLKPPLPGTNLADYLSIQGVVPTHALLNSSVTERDSNDSKISQIIFDKMPKIILERCSLDAYERNKSNSVLKQVSSVSPVSNEEGSDHLTSVDSSLRLKKPKIAANIFEVNKKMIERKEFEQHHQKLTQQSNKDDRSLKNGSKFENEVASSESASKVTENESSDEENISLDSEYLARIQAAISGKTKSAESFITNPPKKPRIADSTQNKTKKRKMFRSFNSVKNDKEDVVADPEYLAKIDAAGSETRSSESLSSEMSANHKTTEGTSQVGDVIHEQQRMFDHNMVKRKSEETICEDYESKKRKESEIKNELSTAEKSPKVKENINSSSSVLSVDTPQLHQFESGMTHHAIVESTTVKEGPLSPLNEVVPQTIDTPQSHELESSVTDQTIVKCAAVEEGPLSLNDAETQSKDIPQPHEFKSGTTVESAAEETVLSPSLNEAETQSINTLRLNKSESSVTHQPTVEGTAVEGGLSSLNVVETHSINTPRIHEFESGLTQGVKIESTPVEKVPLSTIDEAETQCDETQESENKINHSIVDVSSLEKTENLKTVGDVISQGESIDLSEEKIMESDPSDLLTKLRSFLVSKFKSFTSENVACLERNNKLQNFMNSQFTNYVINFEEQLKKDLNMIKTNFTTDYFNFDSSLDSVLRNSYNFKVDRKSYINVPEVNSNYLYDKNTDCYVLNVDSRSTETNSPPNILTLKRKGSDFVNDDTLSSKMIPKKIKISGLSTGELQVSPTSFCSPKSSPAGCNSIVGSESSFQETSTPPKSETRSSSKLSVLDCLDSDKDSSMNQLNDSMLSPKYEGDYSTDDGSILNTPSKILTAQLIEPALESLLAESGLASFQSNGDHSKSKNPHPSAEGPVFSLPLTPESDSVLTHTSPQRSNKQHSGESNTSTKKKSPPVSGKSVPPMKQRNALVESSMGKLQRYDNSDLYKPRPLFSQTSRRARSNNLSTRDSIGVENESDNPLNPSMMGKKR